MPSQDQEHDHIEIIEPAVIFLSGPIDEQHLQICGTLLSYHYDESFKDPIQMVINSPGGMCTISWSIIDVMNFIRLPVHTIALGTVASAGADIFINGDHRTIGEHSELMLHAHSGGMSGEYDKLMASIKAHDMEHDKRVTHYALNSNCKTSTEAQKVFFDTPGNDLWLTPKEVLKHGLCDSIAKTDKSKRRKRLGPLAAPNKKATSRTKKK